MKVFLDLDGVVASFVEHAFEHHHLPNPYSQPDYFYDGERSYDLLHYAKIDPESFWSPFGREFWATIPPTVEAGEVVSLCIEFAGIQNVVFLTSPCQTPGCVDGKKDWVEKYFPYIPVLFSYNSCGPPPKHMLASPDSVLIDDSEKNVDSFYDYGGAAFLYPRPWNRDHSKEKSALYHLETFLIDQCQRNGKECCNAKSR